MKNIKNLLVSLIIFLAALFILMPEIENIASDNIETLKVYLKTTNNDVLKNELKEVADSLGTTVQYVSDSKLKYKDIVKEEYDYSEETFNGDFLGIKIEREVSQY